MTNKAIGFARQIRPPVIRVGPARSLLQLPEASLLGDWLRLVFHSIRLQVLRVPIPLHALALMLRLDGCLRNLPTV